MLPDDDSIFDVTSYKVQIVAAVESVGISQRRYGEQ